MYKAPALTIWLSQLSSVSKKPESAPPLTTYICCYFASVKIKYITCNQAKRIIKNCGPVFIISVSMHSLFQPTCIQHVACRQRSIFIHSLTIGQHINGYDLALKMSPVYHVLSYVGNCQSHTAQIIFQGVGIQTNQHDCSYKFVQNKVHNHQLISFIDRI